MKQTVLKTTNLTKTYKEQIAVNNVNINIQSNDVYGLIGQNGAGKTTLIRMIASLTNPDSGEIELLGKTGSSGLTKARKKIGCIVETPVFYPNLTAAQNLEYYRLQRGIKDKACVNNVLKTVDLTNTGKKKYKNFSLGMKQRLGLALAILDNPEFILLDEPINGLDPTGIISMREIIGELNKQGITILISSHILSELSKVATRYGFIHNGKLVKEITNEELNEQCRSSLHIEVSNAQKAASILEKITSIKDYKVLSSREIRVYSNLERPSSLTKMFFENGIEVNSIHEVGDNLEDYYMSLIKGEEKNAKYYKS